MLITFDLIISVLWVLSNEIMLIIRTNIYVWGTYRKKAT